MSVVMGAPDQIKTPTLSSVDGVSVATAPTALGGGCYTVTVKTRVYANSPAQACLVVQDLLLGKGAADGS